MCLKGEFNNSKSEAFGEHILTMLNGGALAIMISIGHRTGLFDIMDELPPSSSEQIAEAAGLNERYVREWLGALTTGKIVDYDPETKKYNIPVEHAVYLTRKSGPDNIGVFSQYIPLMGTVEDKIIECFKNGGGISYTEYTRFHEVMAEDSEQSIVSSLIDVILPSIPGIVEKLNKGISVIDLGCGRGKAVNLMASLFPKSKFTGYDLSEKAIEFAKRDSNKMKINNIRFETVDLTYFHEIAAENSFDFITTFDAVHDQARPDNLLKGIYKALKNDGTYLMQDISASGEPHKNMELPVGPMLYTISTMHCMPVSLSQGGFGLGTMWGREKAMEMLSEAGFNKIDIVNFDHDFQNDYYIIKK